MDTVATLTIRNIPQRVVSQLKAVAKRHRTSMEHVVRDLLEEYAGERSSVLKQVEASWQRQARQPSAQEVDAWITTGRDG